MTDQPSPPGMLLFRHPFGSASLERDRDGRLVVIKRLSAPAAVPEEQAVRLAEHLAARATALQEVKGPHVRTDGEVHLVGREVTVRVPAPAGRCLRAALDGGARFSETETIRLIGQLAGAAGALRTHEIAPAAVTPEAVFVGSESAVLVDLASCEPEDEPTLWEYATPPGDVRYLSPESLRSAPTDEQGVVWSLGVLAFTMLTGRPPFPGGDAASVLAEIEQGQSIEAALGGTCRPATARLVAEMLERDPRRRLPSLAALVTRTGAAARPERPARAVRATPRRLPSPGRRRSRLLTVLVALAGGVCVLAAAALVASVTRHGDGAAAAPERVGAAPPGGAPSPGLAQPGSAGRAPLAASPQVAATRGDWGMVRPGTPPSVPPPTSAGRPQGGNLVQGVQPGGEVRTERVSAVAPRASARPPIIHLKASDGGSGPESPAVAPTTPGPEGKPVVPLAEAAAPGADGETPLETPEPEEESGTIEVRVNAPGAEVRVDGYVVGRAPGQLRLPAGSGRKIEIAARGYRPWVGAVNVRPNEVAALDVTLERKP